MKWYIKDKIVIPGTLPKEGSLLTKTLCRDINEKVLITVKEIKASGLEIDEEGAATWKENIEVKIDFTNDELALLISSAKKINEKEKVNDTNYELIKKLCD